MRIRANNPSPMTLTGTNTYVLTSVDDTSAVIIDPGPELAEHRNRFLAEVGERTLSAIILTHQHADHSEMLGSVEQWAPRAAPGLGCGTVHHRDNAIRRCRWRALRARASKEEVALELLFRGHL